MGVEGGRGEERDGGDGGWRRAQIFVMFLFMCKFSRFLAANLPLQHL